MGRASFKRCKVTVKFIQHGEERPVEVEGWAYKGLAVTPALGPGAVPQGTYALTHVASGRRLPHALGLTLEEAKALAKRLADQLDWTVPAHHITRLDPEYAEPGRPRNAYAAAVLEALLEMHRR